ncbi:hypothetical protein [Gudongella oleilytica]|jgi:hypothetical protein|uniref:hypothetical protein n=1 Tax=Gudongella oleilytica TaxID=1582259 RepID=UPI002A36EF8B|nr:hypothetical protein [Gudongella oleilytica]MDY0256519.1 hypothetical protein [Gudongella oleilytica]
MSIFEAIMLLCFGAAWPFSIIKSYKSRSVAGKSPYFLIVVIIGYISGIINKLLYSNDIIMYLYILNLLMVATDLVIYYRNVKLAKNSQIRG